MKTEQHSASVKMEQLERRWLLASYHVADYFPMPTGATWTYSGTKDGVAYTETERYSPATFNGLAVICDATTDVKLGGTTTHKTYLRLDAAGVRIYGGRFADTDGTISTLTYRTPMPLLLANVSDGQILRWSAIPFSMSIQDLDGSTSTLAGTHSGTVTVNGVEWVDLPGGKGSVQALKFTMRDTVRYAVERQGRMVTVTDSIVNTGWQVKGLGSVRTLESERITFSDGSQPKTHADNTTLTGASLLLNFALAPAKVAENQPAGTVVGVFSPASPNPGGQFTYQFAGTAAYPDNAAFTIVDNQLLTSRAFNYEAKRSYSIRVVAKDAAGTSFAKTLVVQVTNVNEAPTGIAISRGSVAESMPAGTVVGRLSATDPDAGNTLVFSLVDGEGAADNAAFAISRGQLTTARRLSYDTKSAYHIRVRATDQGGLIYERPLAISVSPSLLVVRLSNGTLSVHGSNAADRVSISSSNGMITATLNGRSTTFKASQVQKVVVFAFAGNDSVNCSSLSIPTTLWGGAGKDTLFGSQADDLIYGGADDDVIYGRSGNDMLDGGTGHNSLHGGAGNDVLYSRNGAVDTVDGGSGTNSAQIDSLLDNVSLVQALLA